MRTPSSTARAVLTLALLAGIAAAAVTNRPERALAADEAHSRVARELASMLPRMHLSRVPVDDRIAQSALDLYLNSLDFDHVFFLASDVTGFRRQAAELDDQLKRGELQVAFDIFKVFKQRVQDRVAYTEKLVGGGFDLKTSERYAWKRKKAPWATDQAQWDDLWRRRI